MSIRGNFVDPVLAANGTLANKKTPTGDGLATCSVKCTGGSNNVCAFTMPAIGGPIVFIRATLGAGAENPGADVTLTLTDSSAGPSGIPYTVTIPAGTAGSDVSIEQGNECQRAIGYFSGPVSASLNLASGKSVTLTFYSPVN